MNITIFGLFEMGCLFEMISTKYLHICMQSMILLSGKIALNCYVYAIMLGCKQKCLWICGKNDGMN